MESETAGQRHDPASAVRTRHGLDLTHNPKVAGSNPAPATNETAAQKGCPVSGGLLHDLVTGWVRRPAWQVWS